MKKIHRTGRSEKRFVQSTICNSEGVRLKDVLATLESKRVEKENVVFEDSEITIVG